MSGMASWSVAVLAAMAIVVVVVLILGGMLGG